MPVRVRLTRVGSKKNPIWRVVVADGRSPRDGRFIETVGHYNPQTQPSTIVLDRERLQHWIERGAQPSHSVKKLMRAPDTPVPEETGAPAKPVQEPAEPETVVAGSEPAEQTEPAEGVPEGAEAPSGDS
jgi:small subunit ribosomal protein S16